MMTSLPHPKTARSDRYRPIPGTDAERILSEYAAQFRAVIDQITALVPGNNPAFTHDRKCIGAYAELAPKGWCHHDTEPGVIIPDTRTPEGKRVKKQLKALAVPGSSAMLNELGLRGGQFIAKVDQSNGWIFPRYSICFHEFKPLLIVNSDSEDERREYRGPVCPEGFEHFDTPLLNGDLTFDKETP